MIRTVTLNTGFDELFVVSGVAFGGVEEILDRRVLAAGKGINAARVVRALGQPVVAYGLVGQSDRAEFEASLQREGVDAALVSAPGRTRRNLTLLAMEGEGRRPAAHFRARGFDLTGSGAIAELTRLLSCQVRDGDVVTINGSTPRGAPADSWAAVGRVAWRAGARLIVDVYSHGLAAVLEDAEVEILACTPNRQEIADLPGCAGAGGGAIVAALRHMARRGVGLPVVTLEDGGAQFADAGGVWAARCAPRTVRVAVGAGDAFVGGLAVAAASGSASNQVLVRSAMAAATAHVEGTPTDDLRARAAELEATVGIVRLGDL